MALVVDGLRGRDVLGGRRDPLRGRGGADEGHGGERADARHAREAFDTVTMIRFMDPRFLLMETHARDGVEQAPRCNWLRASGLGEGSHPICRARGAPARLAGAGDETTPASPQGASAPRHQMHFPRAPPRRHPVVAAHEQAPVLIDPARRPRVPPVVAHPPPPQRVPRIEPRPQEPQSPRDDDVHAAIDPLEDVREDTARSGGVPTSASDVARSASSTGKSRVCTLIPTPTITASTRDPTVTASTRMPAIFRPSTRTSFGHLSRASRPGAALTTASRTASPTAIATGGNRDGGHVTRSSTEKSRFSPRGDVHARPCRPRPAVCSSATHVAPCGAPSLAPRFASSFVDVVDASRCIGRPSAVVRSATSAAAFTRSGATRGSCTSFEVEAHVGRGHRVRQRAHRDRVHPGAGEAPECVRA